MIDIMDKVRSLPPGKPLIRFLETAEGDKLMIVVMKMKQPKPPEQTKAGGDLSINIMDGMGSGDGLVH